MRTTTTFISLSFQRILRCVYFWDRKELTSPEVSRYTFFDCIRRGGLYDRIAAYIAKVAEEIMNHLVMAIKLESLNVLHPGDTHCVKSHEEESGLENDEEQLTVM